MTILNRNSVAFCFACSPPISWPNHDESYV